MSSRTCTPQRQLRRQCAQLLDEARTREVHVCTTPATKARALPTKHDSLQGRVKRVCRIRRVSLARFAENLVERRNIRRNHGETVGHGFRYDITPIVQRRCEQEDVVLAEQLQRIVSRKCACKCHGHLESGSRLTRCWS